MRMWDRWRHRGFPGVNLVGYARGGLGLGETLRRLALALHSQGLPFAVVDTDLHLGDRGRDTRLDAWITPEPRYPVNLIVVTAAELPAVRAHLGTRVFEGRLNLGYWFWELESFPTPWLGAFDCVDEAWTATEFIAASLRPHAHAPVRVIPHPVMVPTRWRQTTPPERRSVRQQWGLNPDPPLFLCTFDFHSSMSRKNPLGVIQAFKRAFGPPDARADSTPEAQLLIKSSNGHAAPGPWAELQAAVGPDPRIRVLDRFLDHDAHMGLMAAADVHVSLHRSEGFGQGMAEAMLMGQAVIATAYSGNLDFMNERNSALVQATRVALGPDDYPCGLGQVWADPDLDEAARWMRQAARDPAWRQALGRVARADVERRLSPQTCALVLRDAIKAAWAAHQRAAP